MYEIKYEKKAEKALGRLSKEARVRISLAVQEKLAVAPQLYTKPLKGQFKGYRSFRVGDYRLICDIKDDKLIVEVIEAGHRKNIYTNF